MPLLQHASAYQVCGSAAAAAAAPSGASGTARRPPGASGAKMTQPGSPAHHPPPQPPPAAAPGMGSGSQHGSAAGGGASRDSCAAAVGSRAAQLRPDSAPPPSDTTPPAAEAMHTAAEEDALAAEEDKSFAASSLQLLSCGSLACDHPQAKRQKTAPTGDACAAPYTEAALLQPQQPRCAAAGRSPSGETGDGKLFRPTACHIQPRQALAQLPLFSLSDTSLDDALGRRAEAAASPLQGSSRDTGAVAEARVDLKTGIRPSASAACSFGGSGGSNTAFSLGCAGFARDSTCITSLDAGLLGGPPAGGDGTAMSSALHHWRRKSPGEFEFLDV